MRDPLSVVVITRNEEAEIDDCLRSVAWADEIVVLDSGSTDKTVEIARRRTDRIFQAEFDGFADQKRRATDLARGPWILNVDADERVTEELGA
ncbi:MAG: glycosyltransferase family 2 protein, partial [Candidatus Latescibacterota bacterium]